MDLNLRHSGHSPMARIAPGEIDTEAKKQKLLNAYVEEFSRKYREWENLQVLLVAGPDCTEVCRRRVPRDWGEWAHCFQ